MNMKLGMVGDCKLIYEFSMGLFLFSCTNNTKALMFQRNENQVLL